MAFISACRGPANLFTCVGISVGVMQIFKFVLALFEHCDALGQGHILPPSVVLAPPEHPGASQLVQAHFFLKFWVVALNSLIHSRAEH
ncbi:unnamed protein product [Citrullus colocynthis]|uniref:Uncharacterized protein n=1 Tax=Citrullus colocynthis TaxID=252529 RepID=A0ABP0ZAK9_9ROSI